ncbi:hypothetical protein P4E94_19805, partial [Pontiellaceae bacterium B12219]|nr:hypothetical protein [Pontiellaceae bacterium B12219]
EGSLEAIREGLSQRLDLNLSDIGEKITDVNQISESVLTELESIGISSDQAVTYLNDIGVTLDDLEDHGETVESLLTSIRDKPNPSLSVTNILPEISFPSNLVVTASNDNSFIESALGSIASNIHNFANSSVGELTEEPSTNVVYEDFDSSEFVSGGESVISEGYALINFVDSWISR